MEKIKLFIIASVVVLSALVIGVILVNLSKDETSQVIRDVEQSTSANAQSEPVSGKATINIQDHAYGPGRLKVKKGTTVSWTNRDRDEHDVTPDKPSELFQQSELLKRGESYSVTFTEVGSYTYHCSPHDYMTGTVEVVE